MWAPEYRIIMGQNDNLQRCKITLNALVMNDMEDLFVEKVRKIHRKF